MTRLFTASAEELESGCNLWDVFSTNLLGQQQVGINSTDLRSGSTFDKINGRSVYAMWDDAASNFAKDLSTKPDEVYVGFWVFTPGSFTNNTFLCLLHTADPPSTQTVSVRVTSAGLLAVSRDTTTLATSATGLSINSLHHIQFYAKPRNSGGVLTIKLDGTEVVTYSGDTTSSQEYITRIEMQGLRDQQLTWIDDIVVNDASGSDNNTWPGIVKILPIYPTAAGDSTQWTKAGVDLGANYRQVNKAGTLDLIQASSTGLKDLYAMEVPDLPAGAAIQNVIVQVVASVEGGSGSILPTIAANSVESQPASALTLTSARKVFDHVLSQNPDTATTWAEADLTTLEMGVESA